MPMPLAALNSLANDRLNDLLIDIGRSLLQYTSECWPWAAVGEENTQATLNRMAAEQRDVVGALAHLLDQRGYAIDFGSYPTDYTSLHYVAVDFLLRQLIANQQQVLKECESLANGTAADDDAKSLLDDIVLSERKHLSDLQQLATSRGA